MQMHMPSNLGAKRNL